MAVPTGSRGDAQLGAMAAELIRTDAEIRNEVRQLLMLMIRHAKHVMRNGNDQSRQSFTKAVVPYLLKGIVTAEADERDQEQKAAVERIMAALVNKGDATEEITETQVPTRKGPPPRRKT